MDDGKPTTNARSDVQPRLGIAHFMLWTVGIAMVLATDGGAPLTDPEVPPVLRIMNAANRLSYALVYGALLSGWILCFWRWCSRGPRFPAQPGHWLLLVTGLTEYVAAGGRKLYYAWPVWEGTEFGDGYPEVLMFALGLAAVGGILIVAAARVRNWPRWRCALGLAAGSELAQSLIWVWFIGVGYLLGDSMNWEFSVLQWLAFLNGVVILVTVILDWGFSTKFDWLHYAGITAWLVWFALPWFWLFMGRIFLSG